MRFINLLCRDTKNYYYPIMLIKNEIFLIRIEKATKRNRPFFIEGIYRYNYSSAVLKKIKIEKVISAVFWSNNCTTLHFYSIDNKREIYAVHFNQLNLLSEEVIEYHTCILKKYWNEEPYKEYPEMVRHRLELFPLDINYVMVLEDVIDNIVECYDRLESLNQFKLSLINTNTGNKFEIMDKGLFINGVDYVEKYCENNKDFLLIKSNLLCFSDKRELVKSVKKEQGELIRGFEDNITIVDFESFIRQVERQEIKIEYSDVIRLGKKGAIGFFRRIKDDIYFEIINFDDDTNEIVKYSISKSQYRSHKIRKGNYKIISDLNGLYIVQSNNVILNPFNNRYWDYYLQDGINSIAEFINERYLLIRKDDLIGNKKLLPGIQIYDLVKKTIIDNKEGRFKVFYENNIVVLY